MANVNVLSERLDTSINYFKTCNILNADYVNRIIMEIIRPPYILNICTIAILMCHTQDFIKSRVSANNFFLHLILHCYKYNILVKGLRPAKWC